MEEAMRVRIFTLIMLILFLFAGFIYAEVIQVTMQEPLQGEPVMMRGKVENVDQNKVYVKILSEVHRGDTFDITVANDFNANIGDIKTFLYDGKGHIKFIEGKGGLK